MLFSQDLYEEALAELEALKEVAPKEASLYFLMGKVREIRALLCFCCSWLILA